MEGLLLRCDSPRRRRRADPRAVPVLQPHVPGGSANKDGLDRSHLQKGTTHVQRRAERVDGRGDREPHVRRCAEVHGRHGVRQHDMVSAVADSAGVVLPLGHFGAFGAGRTRSHDHPHTLERLARGQGQEPADKADEVQGREGQVDERGPGRDQSAQGRDELDYFFIYLFRSIYARNGKKLTVSFDVAAVRLGTIIRAANLENKEQRDRGFEESRLFQRRDELHLVVCSIPGTFRVGFYLCSKLTLSLRF